MPPSSWGCSVNMAAMALIKWLFPLPGTPLTMLRRFVNPWITSQLLWRQFETQESLHGHHRAVPLAKGSQHDIQDRGTEVPAHPSMHAMPVTEDGRVVHWQFQVEGQRAQSFIQELVLEHVQEQHNDLDVA